MGENKDINKAWRKRSWLDQNPKFHGNGIRLQEVLLYPCVSTPREVLAQCWHINKHQENLLKQARMEGVRSVVQQLGEKCGVSVPATQSL